MAIISCSELLGPQPQHLVLGASHCTLVLTPARVPPPCLQLKRLRILSSDPSYLEGSSENRKHSPLILTEAQRGRGPCLRAHSSLWNWIPGFRSDPVLCLTKGTLSLRDGSLSDSPKVPPCPWSHLGCKLPHSLISGGALGPNHWRGHSLTQGPPHFSLFSPIDAVRDVRVLLPQKGLGETASQH